MPRLSPSALSFLEVEVIGAYLEDEDPEVARIASELLDHLNRTGDLAPLAAARSLVLDALNGLDDAIETGEGLGAMTRAEARALHRSGSALLRALPR